MMNKDRDLEECTFKPFTSEVKSFRRSMCSNS